MPVAGSLIAYLPSPSFNVFHLGPLRLRMYGLCIALGVVAAVMIASRRWERRGGNPDDITGIALWAVPAGVIGARLYHLATDWELYRHDPGNAWKIWDGGLGIPGGILLGTLAGVVYVRRKGLPVLPLMDSVAPGLPIAQAIGRLGNWFNQELYGRPTKLPWGLKIDAAHAQLEGYHAGTFQPTFLYEALWNVGLAVLLVALDKRRKLRAGEVFVLYVIGYAIGRFWVESLRSDHANHILGLRVNTWMSMIVGGIALVVLVWRRRNRPAATSHLEDRADAVVLAARDEAGEAGGAGEEPRPEDPEVADPDGDGPVDAGPAGRDAVPVEPSAASTEDPPPDGGGSAGV